MSEVAANDVESSNVEPDIVVDTAPTFFTGKKTFKLPEGVDPVDMKTQDLIEASENLSKIFDVLGNSAFNMVKTDIDGNIAKLKSALAAGSSSDATFKETILADRARKGKGVEGTLWLLRGLQFTQKGLLLSSTSKAEVSESFTEAYEKTLKPVHKWIVRPMFAFAMKACPYRKDFYSKLALPSELDEDMITPQAEEWSMDCGLVVDALLSFYKVNDNFGY